MSSQLFATAGELDGQKTFGNVYRGRYHMPLLPGEQGTKHVPVGTSPYVPRGVMRASNLAGAISESRALGIWERERTQLGLALRPDLYERLAFVVRRTRLAMNNAGMDFATHRLRDSPDGQALQAELELIHEEARQACGANAAGLRGTNHHDVWEAHGFSGQWLGAPEVNANLQVLDELLAAAGLERVQSLQERVVRNVALGCAGRFDNILRTTREIAWLDIERKHTLPARALIMADLKTKKDPFWSLLEPSIQLYTYASAEWMLDGEEYVSGPVHHVSQKWGAILRCPVDGSAPSLLRIDLEQAGRWARLARDVVDARSTAKSVETHAMAAWA